MLGNVITEYVYELLENEAGLKKVNLDDSSFIFVSPEWKESHKLLILINGAGVVRAGQWAR